MFERMEHPTIDAVARRSVLSVAQAKLVVGAGNDPLEAEADRVADQVLATLQRRVAPGTSLAPGAVAHRCDDGCVHRHIGHDHHDHQNEPADRRAITVRSARDVATSQCDGMARAPHDPRADADSLLVAARLGPTTRIARRPSATGTRQAVALRGRNAPLASRVQRHAGHQPEPEVGHAGGDLGDELTTRLRRSAGSGSPLPESVRAPLESAFGAGFGDVRVHTDSDVAPRIGAEAFTLGTDIHFAPGAYRPAERSGQWLLSHELTHVVQQGGSVHRHEGTCIQRHASKEHYLLGSMTPDQIRAIADAKAASEAQGPQAHFAKLVQGVMPGRQAQPAQQKLEHDEALQAVREQLKGLEKWRTVKGPADPDPSTVRKGGTLYDHEWGGQLVTVPCRDGELVCTVGELNALPDFFGSFDDLKLVDRSIAFKTFQVIRRETYVYLKTLEAQLVGGSYSYDEKAEEFSGLAGNKVSLGNAALPKFGNDAADVLQTSAMLSGGPNEKGLDASIGADATLGRNACHFPPESWLRWREHHERARTLIASAADLDDLNDKANHAIAMNAFGEHYLQDSYAAGHLINKGFVMAVAMQHASSVTKWNRGLTDEKIAHLQQATAHTTAYNAPQAAQDKLNDKAAGRPERRNVLDDPTLKARDPQSALEAAKATKAGGATQAQGKRAEVVASGIDPSKLSFEQYRTWLNDFWVQKITNTLHDKYCVNGLEVSTPDRTGLFKIYGDNHMMRSAEGAEYTAATSKMSRDAINALVRNRRLALTKFPPGVKPRGMVKVTSTNQIIARLPNTVKDDDGTVMPLATWATGAPMRKKIAELVSALSKEGWAEGKLTALVRVASTFKDVAAGLSPAHGPF